MAKEDFVIENGKLIAYRGAESEVVIPEGVTSIENDVFLERNFLTKVVIPEGVKRIGWAAFFLCDHLTSISIPASLASLDDAFMCNEQLTNIEVHPNNEVFCAIDGSLYSKGGEKIILARKDLKGVFTVPDTVEMIGLNAFEYCTQLESIVIPDTVDEIQGAAFYACKNLRSVKIPSSVSELLFDTFAHCDSLRTVEIPASVWKIDEDVFKGCANVTIKAPVGSQAEKYAKKKKIKFEPLDPLS